ncbi:SIR2 family protein [Marinobacterium lutimaris]|uniref:TIR domain-containing protein n=1 Tax=Marinobacterium lutimaris TaxID=568106 RepID=A0A1H6DPJ3_9GAMM|nr:SIR2 family protein [Marinobacterium lutimaris]SEG87188.1 TIR domain-containing protein [Marinobacterium lutimaris]
MKIYLTYSDKDNDTASVISSALKKARHKVIEDPLSTTPGENVFKKLEESSSSSDAYVVILSTHSLASDALKHELSALALNELSKSTLRVIPLLIDKSQAPSYLIQDFIIDMSDNLDLGISKLLEILQDEERFKDDRVSAKPSITEKYANQIQSIAESLHAGQLTLFCGAGVTIGAGVPSWNKLLLTLLESMMRRVSNDHSISLEGSDAGIFQRRYKPSSLLMGKYLKNNLGKDFLKEIRSSLYSSNPHSCDIIDAIVELSRPQRDGKPLDSIITTNFDSLLEENLKKQNINFHSIYKEGARNSPKEIPIYHVNGFLPRKGEIPSQMELVFSEDAYHNQFIEPFSWSNLIQLNKISQNTCLFIGLSLSDPNLRRLLDVANRKNPEKVLNHYIIKKTPGTSSGQDPMDALALLLEEQDANDLGLNVLWADEFEDIAPLLLALTNNRQAGETG